jgi:fibronectin-binding autotransporter adhesin
MSENKCTSRRFSNRSTKFGLVALCAASAAIALSHSNTALALSWDPSGSGTAAGSGGPGTWDLGGSAADPSSTNTVWSNGGGAGTDVVWTDATVNGGVTQALFGGSADVVTVGSAVSTSGIVFNTSGYTLAAASPTAFTITAGVRSGSGFVIDARGAGIGSTETIDTPVSAQGTSTNWAFITNGTINFNATVTGAAGTILFSGNNQGTALAPDYTDAPANYVFTAQALGTFEIGGGNPSPEVVNPAQVTWSDANSGDVFGGATKTISISYNGLIDVTQNLNIPGELNLGGGVPSGMGDMRVHDSQIFGSANVTAGATGLVTATAGPISSPTVNIAFVESNDNAFLINNVTGTGNALTIGSAGTAMSLSSAQNGRVLTVTGSGNTIINSPIEDSIQALTANAYTNSSLAMAGTGTLTLNASTTGLDVYKGATQIEKGTVKLGATNALPTGSYTGTGGTPGAVIFGDVSGNTGTLDLNGNSQTLTSISLSQTSPSALLPTTWSLSASESPFVSLTVAGLTVPVSGLAVGEIVTDTHTGFSAAITSIEDNGKSSAVIKLSLAADPPTTSGADAVTLSTPSTAGGVIGNSSTTSNASLAVNTVANANALWNTYAGLIKDGINGGTMTVGLTVAGTSYLGLTGANTYSGGTAVNGGATLLANNTSGSATGLGPVSVASLGRIGGIGSIGGLATVDGNITPGAGFATSGIGTLSFTSLTLGDGTLGGTYTDDINAAGNSDVIAVTGTLDLNTGDSLNVNVLDSTSGSSYVIATYGSLAGTFTNLSLPPGYSINYGTGTNSDIILTVPEPTTLGMLGIGAVGLLGRRRRRQA